MYEPAVPQYFEKLSEKDKEEFNKLKEQLSMPEFSNQRGRSRDTFLTALEMTKSFIQRGDEDDLKRSLVCGIAWLSNGLAVNVQQMRILMSKCKSSINNSFGLQGYGTIPAGLESARELIAMFPFLKNDYQQLRQWTIRKLMKKPKSENQFCTLEEEKHEEEDMIDVLDSMEPLFFRTDPMEAICGMGRIASGTMDEPTPPEVLENALFGVNLHCQALECKVDEFQLVSDDMAFSEDQE